VGTAGYLPPEGPGQAGADVFSLGKVMYEIGMGRSADGFPELPADLRDWHDAPRMLEFNEIILKACQPDPARRFATAADLGEAMKALFERMNGGEDSTRLVTRNPPWHRELGASRRVVLLGGHRESDTPGTERSERWRRLLEARGVEIDVDLEMTPTVAWARALEKRIRSAHGVVAVCAEPGSRAPLVAYALGVARETANANRGRPEILAVRVKGAPPWPRHIAMALEGGTVLDWNGPEDDESLCEALADRMVGG
jgi:hypothetical protein